MEITDCCDVGWLSGGACRKHVIGRKKISRRPFYLTVASGCSSIFLPCFFFFFLRCFRCPPPPPTGVAKALRGRALRSSQYVYLPLLSAAPPWREETFTSLHMEHRELNSTEPLRNHISLLLPPAPTGRRPTIVKEGCMCCNQCGIPPLWNVRFNDKGRHEMHGEQSGEEKKGARLGGGSRPPPPPLTKAWRAATFVSFNCRRLTWERSSCHPPTDARCQRGERRKKKACRGKDGDGRRSVEHIGENSENWQGGGSKLQGDAHQGDAASEGAAQEEEVTAKNFMF